MRNPICDTIFVMDPQFNVIGILSNNGAFPDAPFFDDTYIQELATGAETYEFSTYSNAITSEILQLGNYIVFKYGNKYKLFQIMDNDDEHKESQIITCYCEMAGLELLTDYCEPFSIEGNVQLFFNTVLQDTNWQLGGFSESLATNIQQVKIEKYTNVYKVIQENIETYGNIEIEFRVGFNGNTVTGFYIDVYEDGYRGNKTYKRFEYGENVEGIKRNRNMYDFASAMIGTGKDGLTFKEIEWKKSDGKPADKPKGQDFIVDLGANARFNKRGKYIKSLYESDDTNPQDLLLHSWERLQEVKEPKFDYEVDLALTNTEFEEISIGDTNYVIDNDYNPPILLECRVGKLEISLTDSSKNKCTLSNYKEMVSKIREPKDGEDGKTPEIGENGNWIIGGFDTGKPSQGLPGSNGEPAKYVKVTGEQVFKYANGFTGTPTPSAITIVSSVIGVTNPSRVWSYKTPSISNYVNMSSKDATIVIMHNDPIWGESKNITIKCSVGDKYDQITLVKVADGIDGTNGLNGADGVNGQDGTSIIWKGTHSKHPSNPQNGWAYYNSTDKKSYVFQSGAWYQMTIDGQDGLDGNDGKDGLSIEYKGELSYPPSNPQKNWTYKDKDNGIVYIYTGLAWEVLTYDGSNGEDGADGQNGLSVFVTYNDSETQPPRPTGNGTTNGWHTDSTPNVVWISQKVASSSTDGTWGAPIKVKGEPGSAGYTIVLSNENHTFPCQSNGNIPSAITTTTKVIALKGTKEITPTIGALPTVPGLTLTKSGATITIVANVGTRLADYGSFDIPITIDNISLTKSFTWSKSKAGSNGSNGSDGVSPLSATLSGQTLMKYLDKTTPPIPSIIPIKCKAVKGATDVTSICSYQWQAYYNSSWNNIGTSSSVNIAYNSSYFLNLDILQIRVNITYGNETITLEHTITKVYDNKYITQQEIFDKLCENGNEFIYTDSATGKIYINASYIKSGQFVADLIKGGILTLGGTGDNSLGDYGYMRVLSYDGTEEVAHLDGGDLWIKGLSVESINAKDVNAENINNASLPSILDENIKVSVNASTGNDNAEFVEGAIYNSLQGAIDSIPTFLNGYDVTINVLSNIREDIEIRGLSGGRLIIALNSNIIYGNLLIRDNSCRISVYGGSANGSEPSTYGAIKPSTMISRVSREGSVVTQANAYVNINYVNIYGKVHATNKDYYYALIGYDGGNTYFDSGKIIGCDNGFRANSLSNIFVDTSTGKVNNYVFCAVKGGTIKVNNSPQCNSTSSTKTYKTTSSEIIISSTFNNWDGTTSTGSNDNTSASTKTVTYKSNYGDTYRSTVYNNWKKDNTVRQGDYGYGDCNGCWFFGTQFANLKGKTITKVVLKIKRNSGGINGDVSHVIKMHNYSSRPAGKPSYLSWSKSIAMSVGETKSITITDSEVLSAIKGGTMKGFGLQSSYSKSSYSVCSGNITAVVTYK